MPIVQHLLVEGFIGDGHALVEPNLIRLQVNLAARLLVELRRIREPDKDGIRLVGILFIAEIDGFNQRRQNDGLARAGGSGERENLRCMGALVGAEGLSGLSPQLEQCHLLKGNNSTFILASSVVNPEVIQIVSVKLIGVLGMQAGNHLSIARFGIGHDIYRRNGVLAVHLRGKRLIL